MAKSKKKFIECIIIFRSEEKTITIKVNFRISGQKRKTKKKTAYLRIIIDEHQSFKTHIEPANNYTSHLSPC